MKIVAVIGNILLLAFTCMVLITDGPPQGGAYVAFALWSLLTLVVSSAVIGAQASGEGKPKPRPLAVPAMRAAAVLCNIVFFGFVAWALVDQYPHPREVGFLPYVLLLVLVPILNLVVLIQPRRSGHPAP